MPRRFPIRQVTRSQVVRAVYIVCSSCVLCTMYYVPLFAQADSIRVKGDTEAQYLTFSGNRTSWPQAPVEGEVFYNSSEKEVKYFDGMQWRGISAGASSSKSIATRVVAASNTPGGSSRADYVCTGSGDQAVINSAFADLGAVGGTVHLLEGRYDISGQIVIPASNISLTGSGKTTVLSLTGGNRVIYAAGRSGLTIARLCIDGNNKARPNYGIYFTDVTASRIERVWIENIIGDCIMLRGDSTYNRIYGCRLKRSDYGSRGLVFYDYENSNYNMVSGNIIEAGLSAANIALAADYCILSENIMLGDDYGVYCDYGENNIMVNNIMRDGFHGIYFAASEFNVICQNAIINAENNGVSFNGSAYNIVNGNTFHSNAHAIEAFGSSGHNILSSNSIFGDDSLSSNAYSLKFGEPSPGQPANSNLVLGNNISSSVAANGDTYGIHITNSSSGNYLSSNLISGSRYEVKVKDDGVNEYTDKAKLTFEPTTISTPNSTLTLNFNSVSNYFRLNSTSASNVNLTLGKAQGTGAVIILENVSDPASGRTFTLGTGFGPVNVDGDTRALGPGDTISLIWNGQRWLQLLFANNG